MDTPNLLLPVVAVIGLFFVLPRVAVSAGHAGDIVAQLFVPPNRSLGWPHGVQETDEPWGWRDGGAGSSDPGGEPSGFDEPELVDFFDVVELGTGRSSGSGLLIPLGPVPSPRPHRLAA
jgi:hypothetical protein